MCTHSMHAARVIHLHAHTCTVTHEHACGLSHALTLGLRASLDSLCGQRGARPPGTAEATCLHSPGVRMGVSCVLTPSFWTGPVLGRQSARQPHTEVTKGLYPADINNSYKQ